MPSILLRPGPIVIVALLSACAHGRRRAHGVHQPPAEMQARLETDVHYATVLRYYWTLRPDDRDRNLLRRRLATYLAKKWEETRSVPPRTNPSLTAQAPSESTSATRASPTAGYDDAATEEGRNGALDHDSTRATFAAIAALHTPRELGRGNIEAALVKPAQSLLLSATKLGDEATALAAHLALARLGVDGDDHLKSYEEIEAWTRESRARLDTPVERSSAVIEVWQAHADLFADPMVLQRLTKLYIERGGLAERELAATSRRGQSSLTWQLLERGPVAPIVARTALDVAAVYLRYGLPQQALDTIEGWGQKSEVTRRVRAVLEAIVDQNDEGREGLSELSEVYRSSRPDVAQGICRFGVQHYPDEALFPLCLARVAVQNEEALAAAGWYRTAIALAPEETELYDESLPRLAALLESRLASPRDATTRRLSEEIEHILQVYGDRFPKKSPALSWARWHLFMGILESNAGQTAVAEKRFLRSIKAERSRAALNQLAILAERVGEFDRARRLYREALAMKVTDRREELGARAEILEHLGDTWRKSNKAVKAEENYRAALADWEKFTEDLRGPALALARIRQGVLHNRLGEPEAAQKRFEEAMAAAPSWRETYAGILSHLVVIDPNVDLALRVFRLAQRQLTLEPEWKVYFALWVSSVAGSADEQVDEDVKQVLSSLSSAQPWWSRLAEYGAGNLPYERLKGEASNVGEHAEADFYEGARLLNEGDASGARALFRRVLASQMVSFYEFAMAQELINRTETKASNGNSAL